jgi:hypothetical protein
MTDGKRTIDPLGLWHTIKAEARLDMVDNPLLYGHLTGFLLALDSLDEALADNKIRRQV